MSITVNIYYKGMQADLQGFANEMISSGIVDRIRSQAGNLRYEYFNPLHTTNTLLLIDQWSDQEALDIHHSSPMMQEIIELRNKYNLEMEVERYTSDEEGITANDKKYIK